MLRDGKSNVGAVLTNNEAVYRAYLGTRRIYGYPRGPGPYWIEIQGAPGNGFSLNAELIEGSSNRLRVRVRPAQQPPQDVVRYIQPSLELHDRVNMRASPSRREIARGSGYDRWLTFNFSASNDDRFTHADAVIRFQGVLNVGGRFIPDPSAQGEAVVYLTITNADIKRQRIITDVNEIVMSSDGTAELRAKMLWPVQGLVSVNVTKASDAAYDISPSDLDFYSDTWNEWQTIRFTADAVTEEHKSNLRLRTAASSTPPIPQVTIPVTVATRVRLALSHTNLTVLEGRSGTFTVHLSEPPPSDVVVTINEANERIAVAPQILYFDHNDSATPQTVRVTALEHMTDVDSNEATINVALRGFKTFDNRQIAVKLVDTDASPRIVVSPANVVIDENKSAKLSVSLSEQPYEDTTVTLSLGEDTVASLSLNRLTFTPDNWNTEQEVTITGADRPNGSGSAFTEIALSGRGGGTFDTVSVPLEVRDTFVQPAGLLVSSSTLVIDSRNSMFLRTSLSGRVVTSHYDLDRLPGNKLVVQLRSKPAGNVTITPTFSDSKVKVGNKIWADRVFAALKTASGATSNRDVIVGEPDIRQDNVATRTPKANESTLTFTPENWNVPQELHVLYDRGSTIFAADFTSTITLTPSGGGVDTTAFVVSLTIKPRAGMAPPHLVWVPDAVRAVEEGSYQNLALRLNKPGSAGVLVEKVSAADAFALTLEEDVNTILFHSVEPTSDTTGAIDAAWNSPVAVRVRALADDDRVDNAFILRAKASIDNRPIGNGPINIAVNSLDNDELVSLVLSATRLSVTEGASATFTVKLSKRPQSTVSVSLAASSGDGVSVGSQALTFTPANWDTAQTVRVTAASDANLVDESATITLTATGTLVSAEEREVLVNVQDTGDSTFLDVIPSATALSGPTSVAANSDTELTRFTARLNRRPAKAEAAVYIAVFTGDGTSNIETVAPDGTVGRQGSPIALTFLQTNWTQEQTVIVRNRKSTGSSDTRSNISGKLRLGVGRSIVDDDVALGSHVISYNAAAEDVLPGRPRDISFITPTITRASSRWVFGVRATIYAPTNWGTTKTYMRGYEITGTISWARPGGTSTRRIRRFVGVATRSRLDFTIVSGLETLNPNLFPSYNIDLRVRAENIRGMGSALNLRAQR